MDFIMPIPQNLLYKKDSYVFYGGTTIKVEYILTR